MTMTREGENVGVVVRENVGAAVCEVVGDGVG